ncbi:hypothetical protein BO83DRAFT_402809 [Aspergillus eucalypticola CBS 122712]|uniref:Uncharacterized protein n=1 Tax=Aspergillus eucalypticola (strain CBS 122712 / IBT 29274) TaxID=1448314 RepID=A0A317UVG0_ASPEC|nr:uncharacterized protein BO83DRAFT_402809 [Aspergillus eucalypticola CBS 122712]PWY64000.1 hypothetical protein BO83DRAFT_402809 [Aspergillus eucalypticola CBS 122712]
MITVTGVAVADRIRQPKPIQLVNKLPSEMEGKRTKTIKSPGSGKDGGGSNLSKEGIEVSAGGKPDRWMNREVQMSYDVVIGVEKSKEWAEVLVTFGQDPAGGLFFPFRLGRLVSLHELGPGHPWPAARIHGPKQLADDPLSRN